LPGKACPIARRGPLALQGLDIYLSFAEDIQRGSFGILRFFEVCK
jgi:hypothetical protein